MPSTYADEPLPIQGMDIRTLLLPRALYDPMYLFNTYLGNAFPGQQTGQGVDGRQAGRWVSARSLDHRENRSLGVLQSPKQCISVECTILRLYCDVARVGD